MELCLSPNLRFLDFPFYLINKFIRQICIKFYQLIGTEDIAANEIKTLTRSAE